jgi:segregation and condensation protein A
MLAEPCLVKLEVFEGPLDLLLYLIKKNQVSIYDIPIAKIMDQYLEYLAIMEELNLEVVGDYLMMAAELGLIKSKMLLPKPEIDNEEEEDPRAELVKRLIEYKRYKDVAMKLLGFDILERDVFRRGYSEENESGEKPLLRVDLWALVDAFRNVYRRRSDSWLDCIEFELENVTLDEKINELVSKIKLYRMLFFSDLFSEDSSRFDLIITFLALLELVKNGVVVVLQDSPYAPIKLVYSQDME